MPDLLQSAQTMLVYVASFVVVLSVVVFVHEFGHFQVARWRKVAIDTFSIGFGKTLLGWRDRQGVQWKVGALPLGGYVKFADDADAMSTGPREQIDDPVARAEARRKGLFHAQSLVTRSLVVSAGPVANFIFAIAAFAAIALIMGREVTDPNQIPARILSVAAGSAAAQAGLQPGDTIVSAGGASVANFSDLQGRVAASEGQPLSLQVRRGDQTLSITATPALTQGRRVLGVSGPMALPEERSYERYGVVEALGVGASNTWGIVSQTGVYIGAIFAGRESGDQIAGPLGIINVSGQVATSALWVPLAARIGLIG